MLSKKFVAIIIDILRKMKLEKTSAPSFICRKLWVLMYTISLYLIYLPKVWVLSSSLKLRHSGKSQFG